MQIFFFLPVVILLAINIPVPGEARQLGIQRQFALATFETMSVPLSVHRQQIVSIMDAAPAAGTECRVQNHRPTTPRAGTRGRRRPSFQRLTFLQHVDDGLESFPVGPPMWLIWRRRWKKLQ